MFVCVLCVCVRCVRARECLCVLCVCACVVCARAVGYLLLEEYKSSIEHYLQPPVDP